MRNDYGTASAYRAIDAALKVDQLTRETGGATVDPVTLTSPTSGYAVAVKGFERVIDLKTFNVASVVLDFVRDHRSQLAPFGRYVGTWTRNDRLFIDVVRVESDLSTALEYAEANDELAIWDVENGVEILTALGRLEAHAGGVS